MVDKALMMPALSAPVLAASVLAAGQAAHAEEDGMVCKMIEHEQLSSKPGPDGSFSRIVNVTHCQISQPAFDSCTMATGYIEYDPRSGAGGTPKVLPDLQRVVDSGADVLCVEIVQPYYNEQSWMEIPGWAEHREMFPNASKKTYAYDTMMENANSIMQFLEDNNGVLRSHYDYNVKHGAMSIRAAMPASLLAVLADRDDVAYVDVYGKRLYIPQYIELGWESKIGPLIQKEIKHGKQNCTFEQNFDTCPPLARNADGTPVVDVMIGIETRVTPSYEPLVDFLIRNDQTVTNTLPLIVSADVTADFLPDLNARDDVRMISSGSDFQIRSQGGQVKQDDAGIINGDNDFLATLPPGVTDSSVNPPATEPDVSDHVQQEYDVWIGSPLQQIKDGVAASDVQCRAGLILTMLTGGRPACVTEPTAQVLAERGLVP